MTTERFSIVCVSTQSWRVGLPTNRQQIMRRAAERGHNVLFVETGGFLGLQLWRLLRSPERKSIGRRLFSTEAVAPRVRVRKALNVLPWGNKYALANRVNCAVTARVVRRLARALPQPAILWIYDPCAARMAGSAGEAFAVYDCVDDYPEQAGRERRRRALTTAGDSEAATASRLVFATTKPLHERHRRRNPATHLVRNGGDFRHFAAAADPSLAASDVRELARPVIGFAGNFVTLKIDFDLLAGVARARPDSTLLLVGPVRDGSGRALTRLAKLPNVRWVGAKAYEELPRYVAAFDVGLIPYVENAYTRSCFPLKVYEYLAAGKPVVASGVPELSGMEPDVVLTDGVQDFVAAIDRALGQRGEADRARRMKLAAENTWDTRTNRLLDLVNSELRAS